jgi:hypothetical protein
VVVKSTDLSVRARSVLLILAWSRNKKKHKRNIFERIQQHIHIHNKHKQILQRAGRKGACDKGEERAQKCIVLVASFPKPQKLNCIFDSHTFRHADRRSPRPGAAYQTRQTEGNTEPKKYFLGSEREEQPVGEQSECDACPPRSTSQQLELTRLVP